MQSYALLVLLALVAVGQCAIEADLITEPLPNYVRQQPSRLSGPGTSDTAQNGGQAVDFDMYAGYITVDETAGRALFYCACSLRALVSDAS